MAMNARRWFQPWTSMPARWAEHRHLSDDRVLALALSTSTARRSDRTAERHLDACPRCERRYAQMAAQLDSLPAAASANFDQVFTPARLQTQRARIRRRLDILVGTAPAARLLDFPFAGRSLPRVRFLTNRWVPAAVAATLLLGITAGQLIHLHPFDADAGRTGSVQTGDADGQDGATSVASQELTSAPDSNPVVTNLDMTGTVELPPLPGDDAGPRTLDSFARLMRDEEFLDDLDLALTSAQVSELASIDALTPRVRDLTINIH
ncbi:MAG: hypothetical protein ABGY72_14675 [bacterium]